MRTCNHCGDTFPDFDVAHVCSKGQYAPKLPAPNLRKAAQELLMEYDAQRFVSIFHTQIEALRAALQSCPDCGKPTPEGSIHTCSPQKPDSDALIADGWRRCAVGQGESQYCPMAEANARNAKQRLLEIMRKNGLATGHGDTIDDALKELDWQLREAKAAPDDVCEWTYIGDGSFDSPCGVDYDCDMVVHPTTYMNFCCGCGKRIRFIEGENNGA